MKAPEMTFECTALNCPACHRAVHAVLGVDPRFGSPKSGVRASLTVAVRPRITGFVISHQCGGLKLPSQERLKAKVARIEALAEEWASDQGILSPDSRYTRNVLLHELRAALAEPERDEEPEEIHHCDGCGEDYNLLAESHIGHQPERDEEGGR